MFTGLPDDGPAPDELMPLQLGLWLVGPLAGGLSMLGGLLFKFEVGADFTYVHGGGWGPGHVEILPAPFIVGLVVFAAATAWITGFAIDHVVLGPAASRFSSWNAAGPPNRGRRPVAERALARGRALSPGPVD